MNIRRETLHPSFEKSVRSFVAREGRLTLAHKQALEELWPRYGLTLQAEFFDFQRIFGRKSLVTLEIGFGNGASLLNLAQANPNQDFIGVEVYRTGIAKLLYGIKERKLTNIRVFCADATEVLANCIPDSSLHQLQLFFPDPWPKARHHKRRIVQLEFINLVQQKLQPGGSIHMATDWEDYAQHMLSVMRQASGWHSGSEGIQFAARPDTRTLTKFEQRGHSLGHGTWDLIAISC
jgi:tRNA (guanine-N7-)-methyltransferase